MKEYPKYMMATKAIHKLGDISSNRPDLCIIFREDEKNYIGNWVTGYGFINVKFPKETTAEAIDQMAQSLHNFGDELFRVAKRMRDNNDLTYSGEALNAVSNCIMNLRLDLLATRPIRELMK